jgi:hypothetical protein
LGVNSGSDFDAGTYGWNVAAGGAAGGVLRAGGAIAGHDSRPFDFAQGGPFDFAQGQGAC